MTIPTTPESKPDLTDAERAEAIKALREFFEAQGFDVSSMDDADLDPASYERVLADEAPSAGGDKTARGPVELPATTTVPHCPTTTSSRTT